MIQENDLVILFETHKHITYVYVKKDEVYQNRYGAFPHSDMIGKKYGSIMKSKSVKHNGYIYLLAPTPELWSKALKHRTQIVQTLDASAILFHLHIVPGCIVLEAGTGSGSLSTHFSRALAPTGHLYTFEFNQHRAETAR